MELLDEGLVLVVRRPDLALQGRDQLVPFPEKVVAGLEHDQGSLILGFFCPGRFFSFIFYLKSSASDHSSTAPSPFNRCVS